MIWRITLVRRGVRMRFWLTVFWGIVLGSVPAAARVSDIQAGQRAFQSGKYADAIARFSRVVGSGKADKKALAKIFYLRGVSYQKLKRLTPAIADFSNAIWLDELPVSLQSRAYIRRGQLRLLMSQHKQALKDMNNAVRLAPTAMSYSARAEALIRLGDSARALKDLDRALSDKGAKRSRVHYIRAQAFEALGRKGDAVANLQKALSYEPDFVPARQMLAALGGGTPPPASGIQTASLRKARSRGAAQRPYMLTTGSIAPRSGRLGRRADAAERSWMLATRTIRGDQAASVTARGKERIRRAGPRTGPLLRRAVGGQKYVLQLSARRTLETAKLALHHIASVNRDLLAGRELYVEKARSAKLGEIFRVRVGEFSTRRVPAALCNKLKLRGQSCFLARK